MYVKLRQPFFLCSVFCHLVWGWQCLSQESGLSLNLCCGRFAWGVSVSSPFWTWAQGAEWLQCTRVKNWYYPRFSLSPLVFSLICSIQGSGVRVKKCHKNDIISSYTTKEAKTLPFLTLSSSPSTETLIIFLSGNSLWLSFSLHPHNPEI